MIDELSTIVFEKLTADITNSVTAGLSGVKIWQEDRPREGATSYVTFSIDTSNGIAGSAPIYDTQIEVNCFASKNDKAAQLAQAVIDSLNGYSAVENDVTLFSLQANSTVKSFDSETTTWINSVRFSGLTVI